MKGSKDGRQKYRVRVNYIDNLGKNRQIDRVAYGSAEAKDLERKLQYELKERTPTARMTVNNLCDEYLNNAKSEVRESTLEKTRTNINIYIKPLCGTTPLDKLTVPYLQKWKNEIDSYISSKTHKPLSITSKQNVYSYFRILLNYAIKMDYIQTNNLTKLGNFKDKNTLSPKKEMDYYTIDEYKTFAAAARNIAEGSGSLTDWNYYVFFSIAFYTGLRKGEIFALK